MEETEDVPSVCRDTQQTETEVILREFMVQIQDGCEHIGRTALTHEC